MDPLLHTKIQTAAKSVENDWWRCAEKDEDHFVGWEDDGTIFWDSQIIIMTDYLGQNKAVTGTYYAPLLVRLKNELEKKRPRSTRKKVVSLRDIASSQTSTVAVTKLHE